MPSWPSPAERRALDAFPEQIGPEDLDEHFKLSPAAHAINVADALLHSAGVARSPAFGAMSGADDGLPRADALLLAPEGGLT
jgi:hypothetical protein